MSIIARLGVWLGLNTTEFVKGLDEATKKTREFERNNKRALKEAEQSLNAILSLTAKGAVAISAVAYAVGSAFKYADQIEDTAAAYDVTTEALIGLKAAMQSAGGEAENIGTALNKLASSQQDAIDGSVEIRKAFTELKISGKDVETLNLQDLFKRVAQELAQVEDAGKRAALQNQVLGKAMKGVDASTFVNKYKEVADPVLLAAIKENAKAWDNIELAFRNIAYYAQVAVEPISKIINSLDSIATRINQFNHRILGMKYIPREDESKKLNESSPNIALPKKEGDYTTKTSAAKKATEAREQLKIEIDLIQQKINLQEKVFQLEMSAVREGAASIENKKNQLEQEEKENAIKANAAKERLKEGAQIDLINKKEWKEKKQLTLEYYNEFNLRKEKETYLHELSMKWMETEFNNQNYFFEEKSKQEEYLLDLEKTKFEIGNDAYELQKLSIEKSVRAQEIQNQYMQSMAQAQREYEYSAKSELDGLALDKKKLQATQNQEIQLNRINGLEDKRKDVLKYQLDFQQKMFELDLKEQKEKELFAIESQYNTQSKLLDLENTRFSMSTNNYNLEKLRLENVFDLVAAEQKYLQQQKDAYAEMQRQGGGQKAREQYDSRIKSITEVKDAELEAITKINEARQRNLDNEIARQKSFTEGWKDASKRYQEDAENAFSRGGQAFTSVMDGMGKVMTTWAETGKWKFNDFALSVIGNLIRIELQAQATQLFSMLGSSISSFFTPKATPGSRMSAPAFTQGMASGGFINAPTIVGENGAELFVPNTPGTIIPNGSWQQAAASMGNNGFTNNGTYIASMSAIDTQSAQQFLASNKNTIWAAYQSVNRSIPISR